MTFIVILAILTGMFIGFRRGFLRSVFKLLTAILSIVLSYVLAPVIANWVITYTDWDDSLQISIATQIENTARQQMKSQLETSVGQYGIVVTDDMVDAAMNTQLSEDQQEGMLNQISMPENVRQNLVENTLQQTAGYSAQLFYGYIAGTLAKMIVRMVVYVATFVIISLLLFILYVIFSMVMRMASLGGMNRFMGAVFGGTQMLIYVWIVFIGIHYLVGTPAGAFLEKQIEGNVFLRILDQYNLIQPFVNQMIMKVL